VRSLTGAWEAAWSLFHRSSCKGNFAGRLCQCSEFGVTYKTAFRSVSKPFS